MAVSAIHCFYYAGLLTTIPSLITGIEDVYSNSYISPNSANENIPHGDSSIADLTSGPGEIRTTESKTVLTSRETTLQYTHGLTKRSADPIISKTTGIDDLLSIKNVGDHIDTNDVELSGRVAQFIQPSKTLKVDSIANLKPTEMSQSGEAKGAPQGRSVALSEPREINPTATTTQSFVTLSHLQGSPRQVNPDIQDIITGIVKLLNGKVNVQANTALPHGRPLRPLPSRINNRGPPRITDVPALPPDFDIPSPPLPPPPLGQMSPPVSSTKMPTPYPFDIPPQNTSPIRPYPMSDKIIPLGNKRPGFYRPVTIPPWKRPPQRRPIGNRRPTPIPPYNPLPPMMIPEDTISITSEKPMEDILTFDLGTDLEPSIDSQEVIINDTKIEVPPSEPDVIDDEEEEEEYIQNETTTQEAEPVESADAEFEKNKEKSSAKTDKYSKSKASVKSEEPVIIPTNVTEPVNTIEPSTVSSEIISTTMENITLVDIVTLNESTPFNITEITPTLESSIQDVMQTLKEELMSSTTIVSTPTEGLPQIITSSVIEKIETSSPFNYTAVQSTSDLSNQSSSQSFPYYPYRPRPGIVLDDTEYKPGRQPVITARPPIGQLGDIFDITVSAIQGPGGGVSSGQGKPFVIPVDIETVHLGSNADVITSPLGNEGFVSIDGKRTYLNLFGDATSSSVPVAPSPTSSNAITGTGYAIVDLEKKPEGIYNGIKPTPRRPLYGRRPSQPPVRIDTCIVGDDSTCDVSQHEICRTDAGVSACHCRPGHARRKHRDPCRKIVSVLLSLRVDKLYERRVVWASELDDKSSDSFQQLSYEAERALESAMSMTPFSDEFLGAKVNSIYRGDRTAGQAGVFVNLTLQLEENASTARPAIRGDIQKHLLGVIQRRSNNVGNSALWVDSPPGSVSNLQDLDECSSPDLHDCHSLATCINIFGGFKCECSEGFKDPWADSRHRAGRQCEQCSAQHCNNRGECKYQNGLEVCICSGNYYGNQCELDGEVLGVAIGASVAAVIIIGLTLVCLVMWSRRWNREQKAAVGSPVFGYMAAASNTVKTPVVGPPPYQLTLEDRLRWAQIADVMAQANHYAPEPVTGPTRPSSAVFGYPNLSLHGTLQHGTMHGTLPPVPLPRLGLQAQMAARAASVQGLRQYDNSSSSEEEDKTDLLGRNFQVPRPKSRSNASIANQSGIYYDVDYEPQDIYSKSGIPLSTYAVGRSYYKN